jgi:hypothetical protein
MKQYTVTVVWHSNYHKSRLTMHKKIHRNIKADNVIKACTIALNRHKNVWLPQVSTCWADFPQPALSSSKEFSI